MTRVSPPIVHKCPACAGYFKRYARGSLHYHDFAPEWSDGKSERWSAGGDASVGRCPSCTKVVWVDEDTAVMSVPWKPQPLGAAARLWHMMTRDRSGRLRDEREWAALPREIKEAERIDGLHGVNDFIDALATLVALSPDVDDREVHLRLRLWWESNDHLRLREDGTATASLPAMAPTVAHANVLRLLELFEGDPDHQVERGELLRQLSRFDEAVAVLKAVKPNGYSEVQASKIQRWAMAGNSRLQAIERDQVKAVVW